MRRPTPQFRPIRRTPPPHAARMPAAPNEQVVIDGPAASGKSTVARAVAQALGAFYLSTGDIYRALTWQALARGLDPTAQPDAVVAMLAELTLDLKRGPDGRMQVWLNGTLVPESALRAPATTAQVSQVARIPAVRAWLVPHQRDCRRVGLLVMEGRDIGTVIFPAARYKFFLTATPEERARRRLAQGGETPDGATVASVAAEIAARDRLDSTRAVAPLRQAPDAVLVDSTGLTVPEVVARIVQEVRRRQALPTPVPAL